MNFNQVKDSNNRKYPLCGKLGRVYIPEKNILIDVKCGMWECVICRKNLQRQLFIEIQRNVYAFDLQKHFIITFEGKEYRDKYSIEDSYKFMPIAWHKLLNVINYHYGKIIYILLPRAQKSGYCHYHILTNKYIDWDFLNKKRKKYGLGYVSINKNKDVAEYLANDYYKDHEWMIPKGIRHYRCSREIKLMNYKNNKSNKFFTYKVKMDEIEKLLLNEYNTIYDDTPYYIQKLINKITEKKAYIINYYDTNEYKNKLNIHEMIEKQVNEEIERKRETKKIIYDEIVNINN